MPSDGLTKLSRRSKKSDVILERTNNVFMISFLCFCSAHLTKKRVVQQMLEEGRLEIVTGGWVMTDEATSHIYAMLDQLIEGMVFVMNLIALITTNNRCESIAVRLGVT